MRRPVAIAAIPSVVVERMPRIAWLTQRVVLASAAAQEVVERLADLGYPALPPPFSELPHVRELQEQLVAIDARASLARDEVRRLGGSIVDAALGFVDIPVEGDDGSLVLCWQLGEATIGFWHSPGEPCRERRPLATRSR